MATETVPHEQGFCPIGKQTINRESRVAGATCPHCPVPLPPKDRHMLVTVDDLGTVVSVVLAPRKPLWKQPLFIVFCILLALMIARALLG
jgi:hypothetical protein